MLQPLIALPIQFFAAVACAAEPNRAKQRLASAFTARLLSNREEMDCDAQCVLLPRASLVAFERGF